MSETIDTVVGTHLYVVKGCHETTVDGQVPTSLEVGETGFIEQGFLDRELTVAEALPNEDGTHLFVSQRGWDERGKVVKGRSDAGLVGVETDIRSGTLHITAPGIGSIAISSEYDGSLQTRNVRIHSSILPDALDQGSEAAEFYSEVLGRPALLVRANRSVSRQVPKPFQRTDAINKVAGADGFPFLFVNQASLDMANEASGLPEDQYVHIRQYRGNVETNGVAMGPWAEDLIRKVRIGQQIMYLVMPSIRCIVTNNPQDGAEGHVKGLRVLRGHDGMVPETGDEGAIFGQNGNHIYVPGTRINVGDEIAVLEQSDTPNFVSRTA